MWFETMLTAAEETSEGGGLVLLAQFLPFIVILAIFYFFLIRPQQKQQKERQNMLEALEKGDKVITVGGIYGEISELREDSIILKAGDKLNLKMTKASVSKVID